MVKEDTYPTSRIFVAPARGLLVAILASAIAVYGGCAQYMGTTAKSFLIEVRQNPDPNARYQAYTKLASPSCYDGPEDRAEAVKTLVEKLNGAQEPIASRAMICRTLGELRDPSARDVLIKAANDPEPLVRVQACRALGKVAKPEDATILARVMTVDNLEDCRIAAIEGIAELKSKDPRILQILLAGMEHDDPAIRLASVKALRSCTGQDHGVEFAAWREALFPEPKPNPKAEPTATANTTPKPDEISPGAVPATAPSPSPTPAPTVGTPSGSYLAFPPSYQSGGASPGTVPSSPAGHP